MVKKEVFEWIRTRQIIELRSGHNKEIMKRVENPE